MQEQNFEKQVQFKLDELSLTPSAPVWQKVEHEIRQKNKRRRVIVFWLFALLLIGGGAFWGIYTATYSNNIQATSSMTTTGQSPDNQTNLSTLQAGRPTKQEEKPISLDPSTIATDKKEITFPYTTATRMATADKASIKTPLAQTGANVKQALKQEIPQVRIKNIKKVVSGNKLSIAANQKQKRNNQADRTSINEDLQITDSHIDISQTTTQHNISKQILAEWNDTATTLNIETVAQTKVAESALTIDSISTKKGQKKASKWSWSAQAAFGISSLQTELLSKSTRTPESYSRPIGNAGFPVPGQTSTPSKIENGKAFHFNLSVKRTITKRLSTTAALQYSYFSTKNQIGQTVSKDTSVQMNDNTSTTINQYYRNVQNGPTKKYTNYYHFIELPIGVEWQVVKRIPLKLQTGVSVSYLLSSNALVHDPIAGIYYHNDDLLRRTQVHLFGGLSYRVWRFGKKEIHIGPYLQYGLSGLRKENVSNNYHLLSTGIKTQVSF